MLVYMAVQLSDLFFSKIAGWDAVKRARSFLEQDRVLSSSWSEPVLKGIVQEGSTSYRAGLVIKNEVDVENMCSCRTSREWGTICAHSVAVGLHYVRTFAAGTGQGGPLPQIAAPKSPRRPEEKPLGRRLQRAPDPQSGDPAEIYIILPPNLEQALERGKAMLCLEGKWAGGRGPLNTLPVTQAFSFSVQDLALLERLEGIAGGETPGMLMLKKEEFAGLLPVLVEHPRVSLGKATSLAILKEPMPFGLRAELLTSGEIRLSAKQPAAGLVFVGGEWIYQKPTFQRLALGDRLAELFRGPVVIRRQDIPRFLSQDWPRLQAGGKAEANFRLEDFVVEPGVPKISLELKGGLAILEAAVRCMYGSNTFTLCGPGGSESFWLPDPNSPTRYMTRDTKWERVVLQRLQGAGFSGPDRDGRFRMNGQDLILNFFARHFPRMRQEWEVSLEERLERSTAQNLERIEPRFEVTPLGIQWFDLRIEYTSSGGEKLTSAEVQRLILSGRGYTRLKNGKLAVIDTGAMEELQEVLLDCAPQQHAQGYRMSNTQAAFLEATLREKGWQAQAPASWREKAFSESGGARMECPPLGDLETVLRPYQKAGVGWLNFLRAHNFGGILADEMGLGKTLQTLALLQSVSLRATNSPTLVVCPTSLVWNWVAEAQKFTPGLKVLALHGAERHERFAEIPRSNLVVTSYALVRRDAERYREHEFDTLVLDEAQHIKNRQTQNAQAVKSVRARHRLVLTGTPLENSVLDLWSIFDFLMPGYLGAARDFKERYEVPIAQHRNAAAQARLARRLRPFILRRTKREVAPELPEKLEQVSYCDLSEEQGAIYRQLLEAGRQEVFETVGAQGVGRSRMVIFNVLLRLRQACCDLRLLKMENAGGTMPSGKLALFNELLEEVLDGGHRVLVFSQFVSMLTLLRDEMKGGGIDYCYLDGSTANRGEVVSRFQNQPDIPVFLISLKAGGLGLNLTAADTVIHFDPWWNPAVEAQATDRAHRIGQKRVVNSYKLITRGTVEEKILALQNKKREVIQATLGGEEQLAESLTWEEIQELLSS